MAAQTCTWTGDVSALYNLAGNWDTTVEADRVPVSGDSVIFDNAIDCTLNVNSAALASLDMFGYTGTLALGTNTLDVDGVFSYYGTITASAGARIEGGGAVSLHGTSLPDVLVLELNGGGSIGCNTRSAGQVEVTTTGTTAQIDKLFAKSLDLKSGVGFDGSFSGADIAGDILNSGQIVWSNTGTVKMTADGDLSNNAPLSPITVLELGAGVTGDRITSVYCKKFVAPAGAPLTNINDDGNLVIRNASAGWWDAADATITSSVVTWDVTDAPGNDINLNDKDFEVFSTGIGTITMDAIINLGTGALKVYGNDAGNIQTLDMNGYKLRCGAVVIGRSTGNTGAGVVKLGGAGHSIVSLTTGNAANRGNELHLESCYLQVSDSFDMKGDPSAEGIAVSANANVVHIEGLRNGFLVNASFAPSNIIHLHNMINAGGDAHSNYTFDKYVPPGSLALTGTGI